MAASDPLWGLLYTSRATRALTGPELRALLEEAQVRNEELTITGWLTYAMGPHGGAGVFEQYVEGPRSAVRRLFYGEGAPGLPEGRGIVNDPRHHDIQILQEGDFGGGPPGCRLYPRWFMEYVEAALPLDDLEVAAA
jgi:hypothetical protein